MVRSHSPLNPKFTLIHGQYICVKYMCNKCLNKILCHSSKSPGSTISINVIHFQVSSEDFQKPILVGGLWMRIWEHSCCCWQPSCLLLHMLPWTTGGSQMSVLQPMIHRQIVGSFAATRQRGPRVGIQQRLSLFRHTKDFQTGITIWQEFACFLLCAQVLFLPRLTQNIKSSNKLWSLQPFSFFQIFSRTLLFRHWPHFIHGPQRRRLED